ncbi:MAG: repeat-like domain [Frankiaceae bacterium]|nr:repeat-like domain [Frankiaceae bacterium]
MRRRVLLSAAVAGLSTLVPSVAGAGPSVAHFGRPMLVATMPSGWTEPRVAVAPDGTAWTVTNDAHTGDAIVLSARDGRHWTRTPNELPGQTAPSVDTDIVVTRTGRVIVTELDGASLRFVTGYTDDRGRTWTASTGTSYADTDRPWLAVGPNDPTTHQPRVYLLFHNLFSGAAGHEMFVATSVDGGATFGPPVPIALPGSQAFLDLQCADSGAPSAVAVDQRSGRIYAVFGTRSSLAGGCGASATGTFEINVVGETRVWVATSTDGSAGSWTDSLAYDAAPDTLSASFESAAVDPAGTVYVAFAQTAHPYPDFSKAAIRYVWARPGGARWSAPVTVTSGSPVGTYDPTLVAGAPGSIAVAYYQGTPAQGSAPRWSLRLATVRRATGPSARITHAVIDRRPSYAQTANDMGGSCASGPLAGAENGLQCSRANDDFGIALDRDCRLLVIYPSVANRAPGAAPGTWSARQDGGPRLCRG